MQNKHQFYLINQLNVRHTSYKICENVDGSKALNAVMLFKDRVFNKTATMCDMSDAFVADIQYHDLCCERFMNKYPAKIEEIMTNVEIKIQYQYQVAP